MKRYRLSKRVRMLIREIHTVCTWYFFKPHKKPEQKAQILADLIDKYAELWSLDQKVVHFVRPDPLSAMAGPILGLFSQDNVTRFIARQSLIEKR